ncbi:hypothetical protein AYO40_03755 [Planctomycetaceae bacterium SCGC AG-212-D15]|nr:hypothetical protein AYO40_03755 [Planctomycetaceae bacterium SCGC AG-212-D15]
MAHSLPLGRRQFLRIGTVALSGMLLPEARAASPRRARACILLYMDGGPSHIDLWDMKPDAPEEVRGPFHSIATSVPGTRVCEHLPLVARRMHRLTQVRSVRHTETVHDPAVYQMLTGHKHMLSVGDLTVQSTDFPQMGTAFGRVDRRPAIMPKVIELPETMKMNARVLPGQNAGFLGPAHDPLRVTVTSEADVIPPEFTLRQDIGPARLARRAGLLNRLHAAHAMLEAQEKQGFDRFREQALTLLGRPQIRNAFDLEREAATLRERYGRNRHGQSVLLARRLVEAGARFVTVYWGKEMQDWADGKGLRFANNPWDTHRNHFPLLKNELIPRADRALAALLDDLQQRGLTDDVLVVWMGDFGRTPKIDRKYASRDHWPHANTVLFAGAGCPAGAVIGRTDAQAAEVTEDPVSPADLAATIFHTLGIEPRTTIHDGQGRPFVLSDGTPIKALA